MLINDCKSRVCCQLLSLNPAHLCSQNTLAVVQVMYGVDDTYISVRYHHLIPKSHQLILLKLKYKKTEDNRLNIYIESNDPVISILSTSDFSRLEFKNEVIKEFPQDAIDAVEV